MIRRRHTLLAFLPLLALVGCGGGDGGDDAAQEPAASAAGSAVVTIKTFNFGPDPITVDAGTTITFRNEDKINHTVTAGTRDNPTPARFDGLMEEAGDTFELTLDEPGTYAYFCSFHPGEGMTGEIVVE